MPGKISTQLLAFDFAGAQDVLGQRAQMRFTAEVKAEQLHLAEQAMPLS